MLVLIETYLNKNDKKLTNMVTWQLGMLMKADYFNT